MVPMKSFDVAGVTLGKPGELFLIAGPCVVQTLDLALTIGEKTRDLCRDLGVPYVFKASFDKANRSSIKGHRGPGMEEGLAVLAAVKKELGVPVLTDVHLPEQCAVVAEVVDILQIPAFLCRQTDLILAAAKTGKVLNIKKGQFLAPWDMKNVVAKIAESGNSRILITERGASFGYNTLVSDMRAIPVLRDTGYPVVFDATHSVQQPGGQGATSGGQREFVTLGQTLGKHEICSQIDPEYLVIAFQEHRPFDRMIDRYDEVASPGDQFRRPVGRPELDEQPAMPTR